jgi:hypothetical protein
MADMMTALQSGDAAAFEGLLRMLMATDNEQRSQGEQIFQELQKYPDVCANNLIRGLRSSESVELRSLSAVLLRRVCCFSSEFENMRPVSLDKAWYNQYNAYNLVGADEG